jgi:hypothetical protein
MRLILHVWLFSMLSTGALLVASCSTAGTTSTSTNPLEDSDFLQAVEEVERAGLTPYWMGGGL